MASSQIIASLEESARWVKFRAAAALALASKVRS